MSGGLEGKVVLVTGGASGIGAASVELFLKEGATVAATDVNEARGQELVARLGPSNHGKIAFYRHDVTSEESWVGTLSAVEKNHGKLDVVVNNAGVLSPGVVGIVDVTLEEWRRVLAVNLDGVFLGVKPPIRVNAVHPGYTETDMVMSVDTTLGASTFQKRLNKVVPMRRLIPPTQIAEAIVFLASDRSQFMTGSSVVVDGGMIAQ